MKKILLTAALIAAVIASVLTFGGCEFEQLTTAGVEPTFSVHKVTFEGHGYLIFRQTGFTQAFATVHDPECPKCAEKEQETTETAE